MTLSFKAFDRSKYKLIGLGIVSAIGIITASPDAASASVVCSVGQLFDIQVIQGQSQWASDAAVRVSGAIWQFNDDGTFIYSPANARTDLYPMQGTYQQNGNTIELWGSSYASSNVSNAGVELQGQIDLSQDVPILSLSWASANSMAAVVNNTLFGHSNSAIYQATVSLSC
jgi:hypothetical protein